jgi:hypothetical protein
VGEAAAMIVVIFVMQGEFRKDVLESPSIATTFALILSVN